MIHKVINILYQNITIYACNKIKKNTDVNHIESDHMKVINSYEGEEREEY